MSDEAAKVPLGARLRFLVIGALAGAALVWGLRPGQVAAAPAVAPAIPLATAQAATPAGKPAAGPALSGKPAVAGAEGGSEPVATVDGRPITLREVEDALLRKEGVQQLMDMLDEQFKRTPWEALKDSDVLVQTNGWRVTRVGVAAQLLREQGGKVRDDLIGIALVQNALRKENVVIDELLIENELKRMEKRHIEGLEARKQPYMDFKAFIEQTQKMPLEQYVRQEGFRMGAGIRVLVERRAGKELGEEQLQAWFDQHRERYRVQAAADISDVYIPYQSVKGADGKDRVTQEEKDRLMGVMAQLHQAIFKRQVTFERTFQTFSRPFEPNADANGRVGWINRDGSREQKGARRIALAAMDDVFAAQPPFPALLSPVASAQGIDMILIHDRRPGREPVFAELKTQMVSDIVDAELAPRTKRVLDELRRAAAIDYLPLTSLIKARVQAAGLPSADPAGLPTGDPAEPIAP